MERKHTRGARERDMHGEQARMKSTGGRDAAKLIETWARLGECHAQMILANDFIFEREICHKSLSMAHCSPTSDTKSTLFFKVPPSTLPFV